MKLNTVDQWIQGVVAGGMAGVGTGTQRADGVGRGIIRMGWDAGLMENPIPPEIFMPSVPCSERGSFSRTKGGYCPLLPDFY
jgi:hypothetical protein